MSVLESIFGGPGAGAAGGLPPEIPDPEAPPEPAAAGGATEVDILRQLISLTRDYTAIPSVDERERLEAEKATTIFQKLLADNEKMSDKLTGADPAVRKALGSSGGG